MKTEDEKALIIVKPGFLKIEVGDKLIDEYLSESLRGRGIKIINIVNKTLNIQDVKVVYSSKRGLSEAWVKKSFKYMTSGPICSYLVEGPNAQVVVTKIKFRLRKLLSKDSPNEIKNVIHVPDKHEFKTTVKLFFK